jgi:hypothetical protein
MGRTDGATTTDGARPVPTDLCDNLHTTNLIAKMDAFVVLSVYSWHDVIKHDVGTGRAPSGSVRITFGFCRREIR